MPHAPSSPYFPGLQDHELPKYILVSDFARFRLHGLAEGAEHEFGLAQLHGHLHLFAFRTGYQKREYRPEDPANPQAAELIGALHDALLHNGYHGHKLEVLLVRSLCCLFAEDTAIFEKNAFQEFLETQTRADGSDAGTRLAEWFSVLDPAPATRQRALPPCLAQLPYANGSLFTEFFPFPSSAAAAAHQVHVLRLVAHFARHFRLAVSARDGPREAPQPGGALHLGGQY